MGVAAGVGVGVGGFGVGALDEAVDRYGSILGVVGGLVVGGLVASAKENNVNKKGENSLRVIGG